MIEVVSESRCVRCGICAQVCPTNVFDPGADKLPSIARQSDCQTCYLCEAYCPADALYVAADAHAPVAVTEEELEKTALFGAYRRSLGWGKGRSPEAQLKRLHELRIHLNYEH